MIKDQLNNYLKKLGNLNSTQKKSFPDFLIISPPRTGSTWLSYNLNYHSQIFIPECKELRYFSDYWNWYDINWYLNHFKDKINFVKGEASPPYAILPPESIKAISLIKPNLKLIFIMRDPIERAWSCTKHNYKYREANFRYYNNSFENIPNSKFIENFTHEWVIAFGDYIGCLKRWLSFFQKEQFFIGFYESISNNPVKLLHEIFSFLRVKEEVDWSQYRISEKINRGIEKEAPANLKIYLRSIYRKKTEELSLFLREQFHTNVPSEWNNTLSTDQYNHHNVFTKKFNELNLKKTLKLSKEYSPLHISGFHLVFYKNLFYALAPELWYLNLGEVEKTELVEFQRQGKCVTGKSLSETRELVDQILSPKLVEKDYRGFNIVSYRNKFLAMSQSLGQVDLTQEEQGILKEYQKSGKCFIGDSLYETKHLVDQHAYLILQKETNEKDKRIESMRKDVDGKDRVIEVLRKDVDGKDRVIAVLRKDVDGKDRVIEVLRKDVDGKDRVIEVLRKDVDGKDRVIEVLQKDVDGKNSVIEFLQKELIDIKSTSWFRFMNWLKKYSVK